MRPCLSLDGYIGSEEDGIEDRGEATLKKIRKIYVYIKEEEEETKSFYIYRRI